MIAAVKRMSTSLDLIDLRGIFCIINASDRKKTVNGRSRWQRFAVGKSTGSGELSRKLR
jgi:hypothetical protein